ncbi:AAA family ATPase [Candidatus Bathyarchaeota archaeon]|nr:MAG: AAA family ATPase [Candidatus Bathyarchaeota archaeon]
MERGGAFISSKTLDLLRRLVAERPDDLEVRLHLAELLIEDNLTGEATEILEQALALKPDDPAALRLSAGLCYRLHMFEKARDALEKASRGGPADRKSDLLLSRVYLELGKYRLAEQLYHQAVKGDRSLEDSVYFDSIRLRETGRIAVKLGGHDTGVDFETEGPSITFNDVGGMEDVKEYLRMNIIFPLKNPGLFKQYGKRVGGGIMMFGPPGCGKTYLSRALAGECKATFYHVGIHEILDMYLGSSEKNVHKLFETARRTAPAIVFLDEIDALGQKRSSGGDSWGRALRGTVVTLLAEMDQLGTPEKPILVIGATNTPWAVDLAAREEILKLHLQGKPTGDLDIPRIAKKTEKFSGADIRALVDRAVEDTIKRAMRSGKTELIRTQDLLDATEKMHPSTVEWLATAYDYVRYSNEGGIYDQVKNYLDKNR